MNLAVELSLGAVNLRKMMGASALAVAMFLGAGLDQPGRADVNIDGTVTYSTDQSISGNLNVGNSVDGTLIINGGTTSDSGAIVGNYAFGTVNVTGTSSSWSTANYLQVAVSANGTVTISDGGSVGAQLLYIGASGVSGTITVTGSGSTFTVSGISYLGAAGNGALVIANGGYASTSNVTVGFFAGTGNVSVTGTGSVWNNTGNISLGSGSGDGTVTVDSGGKITSGSVQINRSIFNLNAAGLLVAGSVTSGSSAAALNFNGGTLRALASNTGFISNFTGTGVQLLSGGGIIDNAGYNISINSSITGTGAATFIGTGTTTLTATNSYTGNTFINMGTVAVSGTGSAITQTGTVSIGNNSGDNGNLLISGGGYVSDYSGTISATAGSIGNATVSGTGSTWQNTSNLVVGGSGTATLTVSNGATVFDHDSYIGFNSGSTGSVTVTGTGSTWTNSNDMVVGHGSSGTLTISNGGHVSDLRAAIGNLTGTATGAVTVTDTGSNWTTGLLNIGSKGTGTLLISNGGSVNASSANIAVVAGSSGTVTVTGTGSVWAVTNAIYVGDSGSGILTISNGGKVSDFDLDIGGTSTSTGFVKVDGAGSASVSSNNVYVGVDGSGTLIISNSGTVSNVDGYIGTNLGSTGTVSVDGAGSKWTNSGVLSVGESSSGTLTISNGGYVSDSSGTIGAAAGGTGSVTVTGTGSSWYNHIGTLQVGNFGAGTLTISSGGVVTAPSVEMAVNGSSAGTVNLTSGGMLATGQVVAGAGRAALNFDGGILQAMGDSSDFISNFTGTEVNVASGGGTLDNNGYDITINAPITGTGSLTFTGTATTTLTGSSSYSGGSTISSGIVAAGNSSALGTGDVTVQAASQLYLINSIALDNNITIGGTGFTSNAGAIGGTGSNETISGTVTLAGDALVTIDPSNSNLNLSAINLGSHTLTVGTGAGGVFDLNGNITGGGGLTIDGENTYILGGSNTFTGMTDVLSGSKLFLADHDGTAISGDLAIEDGGEVLDRKPGHQLSANTVLTLNGTAVFFMQASGNTAIAETIAGLSGTSTGSKIRVDSDNWTMTTSVLTLSGTGSYSYAGQIVDNPSSQAYLALIKQGSGTQTLTGTSTYHGGTTVDNGTLAVSGTGAAVGTSDSNILVGLNNGDNGTLAVSNGGKVNSANGYLGNSAGSTGTVTVDGAGSALTTGGTLFIGNSGSGTLAISNGGSVTGSFAYIGNNTGGSGRVTVTGSGSKLTTTDYLMTGYGSSGQMIVSNGGAVADKGGIIGVSNGVTGSVSVTGSGSSWNLDTYLGVGYSGSGTLTVSNGCTVTDLIGNIGFNAGSYGYVSVLGTGSTWNNTSALHVGSSGTATVEVTNGGKLTGTYSDIGYRTGSSGSLSISGFGSSFVADGFISVGEAGTGTLTVSNSGSVTTDELDLGFESTGKGTVKVDGSFSTITSTGSIVVGYAGTGTMTISNGGTVSGTAGYIGYEAGSSGTVTVTGTGSAWTSHGLLTVGDQADALLTIANGGSVTTGNNGVNNVGLVLGNGASVTGTISVDGAGSKLTVGANGSSDMVLGNAGVGVVVISDHGQVNDHSAFLAEGDPSSFGFVVVTGTGATWTNSGALSIGEAGFGFVYVEQGGTMTGTDAYVGDQASSYGSVFVDGAGSSWKNDGDLYLGNSGTASLSITGGGLTSNQAAFVGYITGGTGSVTVTDTNSVWDNKSDLSIGVAGSGTVTISNGGQVNALSVKLATTGTSTGILNIDSGGILLTNQISGGSGDAKMNIDGGIVRAASNNVAFISGFTGTEVQLFGGGATIDNNGYDVTVGAPLTGTGSLTAIGNGTLVLTGTDTYSGGTKVSQGTLAVGNSVALGTGDVVVNGGTLSTDNVNHLITIDGDYTQGANGTLLLNITSSTIYDTMNLTGGEAHLDGILKLNFEGSFAPGQGESLNLITTTQTIDGTFSTVLTNLPSIGGKIDYTNNVTLIFQKAFVDLGIPLTPNQTAVATYIDPYAQNIPSPAFAALVGGLNNASVNSSTLQSAFNQLMPLNFANFASSNAFNNTSFVTQQLDSYLANHRGADGTFMSSEGGLDYSGLAINDPNIDTGLQSVRSRLLAWSPAPSTGLLSDSSSLVTSGTDMKDIAAPSGVSNTWNVFVTGNVILAQDFSDNSAGLPYSHSTTGAAQIGADYKITPHFLVGVTFGYGHTNANLDALGSGAEVNTYSPGVYMSYANNGWYYNALGSYGFSNYSQNRNVNFGGFSGTAHSSPGGSQIVGNLDGGYDFHKNNWTFGPTLGLQYVHLDVDGYSETGLPGADLTVNENQADSLRSRLGGHISYAIKSGDLIFTPHLSASWQHEFMDQSRGITSQFNAIGAGSFTVNTPNPSRDSALIDLGLDAQVTNRLTVFSDYAVQAGQSNYFGQSIQAGVKIGF